MGPVRPLGLIETALATARLTRLVLRDEITAPVRRPVVEWALTSRAPYGVGPPFAHPRLAYLLGCDWCVSIWAASVVVAVYRWPFGRALVRVLAASEIVGLAADRGVGE